MTQNIKRKMSNLLLDIGAVHYFVHVPYKFTSGTLAPVYVDCRKPISFVKERDEIMDFALTLLRDIDFDVVAGGETAGIPYAAFIATTLRKPMVYVRKRPKGFGRNAQIEGNLVAGSRVLLVEDLTFDAQSKINFCFALRNAGAIVDTTLSVFNYGIRSSLDRLNSNGIELLVLTDWFDLLVAAEERGIFTSQQVATVKAFLNDPLSWGAEYIPEANMASS